ncbi:MAG: hypothetical protein ABI876_14730 [Bacteroidota bacterium]
MNILWADLFILSHDGSVTTRRPLILMLPHADISVKEGATFKPDDRILRLDLALYQHYEFEIDPINPHITSIELRHGLIPNTP